MSNGRARRGSIFSGAVLILVGALLLVHSYHPDLEMWGVFSRWWPLLLIFWGALKLYERMAGRRTEGAPSGNVTGGEVLLVIGVLSVAPTGFERIETWRISATSDSYGALPIPSRKRFRPGPCLRLRTSQSLRAVATLQ